MSPSSDKLTILMKEINNLPPEKRAKIKKLEINWKTLDDQMIFPTLSLEFFE